MRLHDQRAVERREVAHSPVQCVRADSDIARKTYRSLPKLSIRKSMMSAVIPLAVGVVERDVRRRGVPRR